jgi:hypothetical protein
MALVWDADGAARFMLHTLLEKYEKSKHFSGEAKVQRKVAFKMRQLIDGYEDHANYELFQTVNEALRFLQSKRWVTVHSRAGGVVEEVALCLDEQAGADAALVAMYEWSGRKARRDEQSALLTLLAQYEHRHPILDTFVAAQREKLAKNRKVQFYAGSLPEFVQLLQAVDALLTVEREREQFVRDFSMHVFRDSKTFERVLERAVGLLFEYGSFAARETVLAELNVVRNPSYVNVKGAGEVVLAGGQRLDLAQLAGDVAFSSPLLEQVERVTVRGRRLVTVENLTSFHTFDWRAHDALVVYLGGFHNRVRGEWIRRLYLDNPDVEYVHFGDLDAGGFTIWLDLRARTGVPFRTWQMDVPTLAGQREFWADLTANDRARLEKLLVKPEAAEVVPVLQYMLEHGCKLEQEAIRGGKDGAQ